VCTSGLGFHVTSSLSHMDRSLVTNGQGLYGSEALFSDGPLLTTIL
jgi:hypothetical protein